MHTAAKRAWLQTGGLPVEPIHADLRAELDQVHDVKYIGGGCFRLRGELGNQVGLVQFQGAAQTRLDQAIAATTERLAKGEAKPVDLLAGDTLIRELDMNDPSDRAMAEIALGKAEANIIIPDPKRADPPPIDLPDYVAPYSPPPTLDRRYATGEDDEGIDDFVACPWRVAAAVVAIIFVAIVVGRAW